MHESTEAETRASILEYARFHGLTRDYRSVHPLEIFRDDIAAAEVEEIPGPFEIDQVKQAPMLERLTMTKDGATLLASVLKTRSRESVNLDEFLPDYQRAERMKVELPLLSSDHAMDMDRFKCRIVPDLKNLDIPLEEVDDEPVEGMGWTSSYKAARLQAIKKSENEKLVFPKEVFVFLSNALKPPKPDCKDSLVQEEVEKLMRENRVKSITPPLLPMSPPILPFVPPLETCQVELLSGNSIPTREAFKRVNFQLMKTNSINEKRYRDLDGNSPSSDIKLSGDVFSPLKGIEITPPLPLKKHQRPEELKVEVPLSPRLPANPPPWKEKGVSFPESLFKIIPDLPSMMEKPKGEISSGIDDFFTKTVASIAEAAKRRVEQEQLGEANTKSRVKVPTMDFTRPVAPWNLASVATKESTKDTRTQAFLNDIMEKHSKGEVWHYSGKEERSLLWAPFPARLAQVTAHETIELAEEELDSWIAQPPCMDINTLVWKAGGLRLAKADDSDEDEIEPAVYPPSNNFAALLKRKAVEISSRDGARAALSKETLDHESRHFKKPRVDPVVTKAGAFTAESTLRVLDRHPALDGSRTAARRASDATLENVDARSNTLEQSFSAFTSIGNYMSLRTEQHTAKVVSESAFFAPKELVLGNVNPHPRPIARHQGSAESRAPHASSPLIPFSVPAIHLPHEPRQFIASAASLQNKKLWRQIYGLYPNTRIIERDFCLLPTRPSPKPKTLFNDENLLKYEADISLSPSMGLIWTTLQKIKQRSLPGQAASSPVRERITHTAPRYEHLIILVSQGCSPNEPLPFTDSDATALATLTSFCACHPSNPEIIFIPGYDLELAQWTVHLMIKYSAGVPDFELQQDQTLWEVWLRRAGMNAFAAQYVLSQMQAPVLSREDTVLDKYRGEFGLAAFVAMGTRERERAFADVVGREVLGRVERNIRGKWGQD